MQNKTVGYRIFTVFNYLIMAFLVIACLFPFIYMFALSFSSSKAVISGNVFLFPVEFTTAAYERIVQYPSFFRAYGNTIFYTVAGTTISLFLTLLFAYPLSKPFLRGRNFFMKMVIFSMFFSGGLIPNFLIVSWLNITDTVWAMLIPFAINQFNLIILINFLKTMPESIEEAALIDGMGYFGILFKIIVPLSLPAIATITLYTAVFFWNDWFYGLIYMNSTERYPVMLILRNIVNGGTLAGAASGSGAADKDTINITLKSAAIILTTAPIICLYPFLQRYFVKGLTVGSVKG
ncbi:MAG: carbohydrate ABC transporter permease [Cellulosilyticaceae bacterium]